MGPGEGDSQEGGSDPSSCGAGGDGPGQAAPTAAPSHRVICSQRGEQMQALRGECGCVS